MILIINIGSGSQKIVPCQVSIQCWHLKSFKGKEWIIPQKQKSMQRGLVHSVFKAKASSNGNQLV
ncbi:hypothetical protein TSUD_162210 [Trifolium subterraneum]|uniref:Uncharacterized protein n=1 Tax=Trifolium subterraneum TaxID=3900 RepID=A0A2Z6MSE2_TRISU|nr:hypothetical protein TSUD_162210 [Trifolium subterraneum]